MSDPAPDTQPRPDPSADRRLPFPASHLAYMPPIEIVTLANQHILATGAAPLPALWWAASRHYRGQMRQEIAATHVWRTSAEELLHRCQQKADQIRLLTAERDAAIRHRQHADERLAGCERYIVSLQGRVRRFRAEATARRWAFFLAGFLAGWIASILLRTAIATGHALGWW